MILGYALMTSGGVPIWFRFFKEITDDKKERYELFSSAIAAVLSLINETFEDNIRELIMDKHRLYLTWDGDIILMVVAEKSTKAPTDYFTKFVRDVASKINPEIAVEEVVLQSIIDSLAEFELKIEELNTLEKLTKIT